jgi:putative component of membrane protein insertase Oxa1/YidC/SpoIIIJ protein YidD
MVRQTSTVCLAMQISFMKHDGRIPDDNEQEEAWEYVCKRELVRPNTNIMKAIKYFMVFSGIDILLSFICDYLIRYFCGEKEFFNSELVNNPAALFTIIFLIITLTGILIVSKKVIIGVVRLYQHYAPERIRRKCIFKPTCSEYMILALEKYGLIKGLYKGMYRMFFRCKGFYYSVDYP